MRIQPKDISVGIVEFFVPLCTSTSWGGEFILFHRAAKTIYLLEKPHAAVAVRDDAMCISRPTRPSSSVHHDRSKRMISIRNSCIPKLSRAGGRASDGPPRVKLSLIQSSTPSSRASLRSDVSLPASPGGELASQRSFEGLVDRDPSAMVRHPPDDWSDSHVSNTQVSPSWIRENKIPTVS